MDSSTKHAISLQEYRAKQKLESKTLKNADQSKGPTADLKARLKSIQTVQNKVIDAAEQLGEVSIKRRFSKVSNSVVIAAKEDVIDKLRNHPNVAHISAEKSYTPSLDRSAAYIGAPSVWELKDDDDLDITGQGITVAIVDTGVNYLHDDLGGCIGPECKVIGGYDFINDDNDPMEDDPDYRYLGHGTHVAGIVAANGRYRGIAPDASILAYKVCDIDLCSTSNILAGLERASDPDGDIFTDDAADIVNISLGNKYGTQNDPIPQAINAMALNNIIVVVAAGNDGGFANLGDIASAEKAITVAANNGRPNYFDDEDDIADFSSGGPVANAAFFKPEVNAPGVDITAPCMEEDDNQANCNLQGTSMASPHVAGMIALLKQNDPELTVDEIRSAVINTAISEQGVSAVMQGAGLVDAFSAVHNTLTASPQIAYFGDVRTDVPSYSQTLTLTLKNRSVNVESYALSIEENTVEGVVFRLLAEDSITIESGGSVDVDIQVEVDVDLLKDTLGKAFTIENKLTVSRAQEHINVPIVLTPFAELDVNYDGWWPRNVTIFNQQHNSLFYSDSASASYYLPLGEYSSISMWDEADKLSFVVNEDIDLYTTNAVEVSKDLAVHRVAISSLVDKEEQSVEISNASRRNGGHLDISYLPAKYSQVYGREQSFNLIHKDLLFSEISENFELRIQTIHADSFDEQARAADFYSFVQKLSGINANHIFDLNAEQMMSQSFLIDAFEQFEEPITSEITIWSRPKPEFESANFVRISGFGKGVPILNDTDEQVTLSEPYTMTVYSSARRDKNNYDLGLLDMQLLTDSYDSLSLAASADFSEQSELRVWQEHYSWEAGRTTPKVVFNTGEDVVFEATHNLLGLKSEVYFEPGQGRYFHPTIKFNNVLGQEAYGGNDNEQSFNIYCDDNLQEEATFAWRYSASADCETFVVRGTFNTFIKDASYASWMEMGQKNISTDDEVSTVPEITHVFTTYQGGLSSRPSQDGTALNVLVVPDNPIESVQLRVRSDADWQDLGVSEVSQENGILYSADIPIPDDGVIAHIHIKVTDVEGNYAEQMIQGAMVVGKNQSETFTRDTDLDDLPDYRDQDIDGDEFENMSDSFPYDPTESVDTDLDGIGNNADTDDDGDGVEDAVDDFPFNPLESLDTDGDGIGNNADDDDDNDSTPDAQDAFPLDASESVDTDGDGVGNNTDTDDDGDGVADSQDAYPLDSTRSSRPAPVTNTPDSGGGGSLGMALCLILLALTMRKVARPARANHLNRS